MATAADKLASGATPTNPAAESNPKGTAHAAPVVSANPDISDLDVPLAGISDTEVSPKDGEDSKGSVVTVSSAAGDMIAPSSNIQKKMKRAERFRMPVQLSEEEKRNCRAERFGTGHVSNVSEASKQSEELKRKARAGRFGLPVPSTAADEEAKKKARLARFASDSKSDPQEEEKRKARALRFSNPPSSSLSQVNGQGSIKQAAIAGKAGGTV